LTLTNLCSILVEMGSTPAEIRRMPSRHPALSAAPMAPAALPAPVLPVQHVLPVLHVLPAPALPAPVLPAPALPAPVLPAPVLPAPALPAPVLPVLPALRELLPRGGLVRGSVTAVAEFGVLALALMAAASAAGAWCGIAGIPEAGILAGMGLGLDPERTLLVPDLGPAWPQVVASLLDGCELVLLRPPGRVPGQIGRRLDATLRRGRGVLLVAGDWPGAQVRLRVAGRRWTGLGDGHGRLRACQAEVVVDGRGGAATIPGRWLWLPDEDGTVATVDIPAAGSGHALRAVSAG